MTDSAIGFVAVMTLSFIGASGAQAAPVSETRSLSVSGECAKKVAPDRASVTLTAEAKDSKPQAASKRAGEKYNKVVAAIKKLNLKDLELETTDVSVSEEVDWVNGKRVTRGYTARTGVNVTTSEISRVTEVIQVAAQNEVENVGGFTPFVSVEKDRREYRACLDEAIRDARDKADKMAQALKVKVGEPLTVSESRQVGGGGPMPMYSRGKMEMMSADAASSAPGIETKARDYSVRVDVVFEIK